MIKNQEALNERANNLGAFNGIKLLLVGLPPALNPTEALLTVHFHNSNQVANIFNDFVAEPRQANAIFPIMGGHRILAGTLADQVQVVGMAEEPTDNKVLHLTVRPIGDYSTYTLGVVYQNIDPLFSEIDFKFRPGCFNNCPPEWDAPPKPKKEPLIDYLAKDYDSFRHTLITWMSNRVAGWQPTSEGALDMVLLSLFSVAADELSDYQDRIMNEAYLSTARKRVSFARHARLMDYHIHQGNQASTWLALRVNRPHPLIKGFQVGTGDDIKEASSVVFMTHEAQEVDDLLNDISLYTWDDTIPALDAGSTRADLKLSVAGQIVAETVQDLIRAGEITHLLIQEHLNPLTGDVRGRDPTKRQLLELLPGAAGAQAKPDPVRGEWFVRVRWQEKDKLTSRYCFTVDCPDGNGNLSKVEDVSLFHGNLVQVYHGRATHVVFKEPGTLLTASLLGPEELYYARTKKEEAICRLPDAPLAYKETPPGGEVPAKSTLEVEVEVGGTREPWDEVISLIHSDNSDERGDHFVVETDELGRSLIRFGHGTNGKKLPEGSLVYCFYQLGRGVDGHLGADALRTFDATASGFPDVDSCWNPFDVTNGRAPEAVAELIRRVPEAYRHRQLRAVTLADYVKRAEELPDVSKASARYIWTGSWRTVRVTIDPLGSSTLSEQLEEKVARHLEAVRLIGEDIEIRAPRFVPLSIVLSLCVHANYWPQDIKFILEQEFSDGYTPDGRMAFFHPDRWTFGQPLHASQLIGAVQAILGVDHVIEVTLQRWNEPTPGTAERIEVQANEIIQVKNDPDQMELGSITFDVKGGRS